MKLPKRLQTSAKREKRACFICMITHASRWEALYCLHLEGLRQHGQIKSFRSQVKYVLVPGTRLTAVTHTVDFLVKNNDGSEEVHEVKGRRFRDWVIRWKMFKHVYPNIPYRVVTKEAGGWKIK